MTAASGPGRRLTEAEEARAVEMYQANASTRAVAKELEISRSSAQQLRLRLQREGRLTVAEAGTADADTETEDTTVTEHGDQADEAELTELRKQHDTQTAVVRGLEERESVSRSAMTTLEAEHLAGLAEGRSDPELRQRYENAGKDAADWAKGAELARGKLASIGRQIEAVQERTEFGRLCEQLAEADAEDRAAAESFVAAGTRTREAAARKQELLAAVTAMSARVGKPVPVLEPVQSTALWVSSDYVAGQPVHLMRALSAARQGLPIEKVCAELGEAAGWLPPPPPSPEEVAAWQARQAEMAQQQHAPRPLANPVLRPGDEASVGVDQHGNPVRWRPVPPHPLDSYRAPMSVGFPPLP